MKRNDMMTFRPFCRERETLPCFPKTIVGQPIECHHQSGTMRLFPGDRVRVEEIREDHALVSSSALKGGVLLTSIHQLEPIKEVTPHPEEDARL